MVGSVLHDCGKVLYRVDDGRKHSISGFDFIKEDCNIKDLDILDCIRYHHKKDIERADLSKDNLAYITYIADNISSKADRRNLKEKGYGFDKNISLYSVFNILNGNADIGKYQPKYLNHNAGINYPTREDINYNSVYYGEIKSAIRDKFKQFALNEDYIASLLEILEGYLTYVPSSTSKEQVADISLYDHLKMTATFATCIYDYFKEKGIEDYSGLLNDSKRYYEKNMFYLYSFDFSGIQSFIYNVTSDKALRSLRTRSFYLEILLEDIIDTLLKKLGLFRANLLYSGGGHCYLILPNTGFVKNSVEKYKNEVNDWLLDVYGSELYLAGGGKECNAITFNDENSEQYTQLFRSVSEKISKNKLNRYSPTNLKKLNFTEIVDGSRECKICKRIDKLIESENGLICEICQQIQDFSSEILEAKFFAILEKSTEVPRKSLPLPHDKILVPAREEADLLDKIKNDENFIRAYTKNDQYSGKGMSTKLWIGDYNFDTKLNVFSEGADGIKRLGVLRADVDNLGQSFVKGFEKEYISLTRSAAFSAKMSLFFKYHINYLLENGKFSLTGAETPIRRRALIVYSGGDDVFVVGAWDDIIEFAIDLTESLEKFTLNSLTISAGIGLFTEKFPIKSMAELTGNLEEYAKENKYIEDGKEYSKNSVCIFNKENVYSWREFKEKILGEKLELLKNYFGDIDERGKSFLYRILDLLRSEETDKLNIARLAYLLARLEPTNSSKRETHREFSKKVYRYARNEKDRKELMAAIYIFVYLERR